MKPEIAWMISLGVLAGYELYAVFTGNETLSRAVWDVTKSPYGAMIPFLVGVFMGHFFFSGK